jgi:hypothetical protein
MCVQHKEADTLGQSSDSASCENNTNSSHLLPLLIVLPCCHCVPITEVVEGHLTLGGNSDKSTV